MEPFIKSFYAQGKGRAVMLGYELAAFESCCIKKGYHSKTAKGKILTDREFFLYFAGNH